MKKILSVITGSTLYGTAIDGSDLDVRGIVKQSISNLINPFMRFEQNVILNEDRDETEWSLDKFFYLASKGNPNIVEILFVRNPYILELTEEGEMLLSNYAMFLSKRIYKTFVGYSMSQLKRIETHRGYLLTPPIKKPSRDDFSLPPTPLFSKEVINNIIKIPIEIVKEEITLYALQEKKYFSAMENWNKYIAWKNGRNKKRAEDELRYGYDLKHAGHLIRLLYEAKDILQFGFLEFPLARKDHLLEIRKGLYKYQELIELAQEMMLNLKDVEKNSKLPENPNIEKLSDLYNEMAYN
jgi:predicted nucleotidyltransferase